jgi:hypothetical protein
MATYYFGVNNGAGIGGGTVTDASTSTSKDVEVVINTTANVPSKEELILSIQKIYDYVVVRDKVW